MLLAITVASDQHRFLAAVWRHVKSVSAGNSDDNAVVSEIERVEFDQETAGRRWPAGGCGWSKWQDTSQISNNSIIIAKAVKYRQADQI